MEIKLADSEFVENCEVEPVDIKEAKDLVDNIIPDMIEFIKEKDGLGLAGPQIGMAKQFFVAKNLEDGEFYPYFNARYFKDSGSRVKMAEGCLTYPEKGTNIVKRFKAIKMKYQIYENGQLVDKEKKVKSDQAIVFQHEIDHCSNGTGRPKTIYTK